MKYESEYLMTLYESLERYKELAIRAEEIAVKEFEFDNGIINAENIQRRRRRLKEIDEKPLDYFLNNNHQYSIAVNKINETKEIIENVEKNYKDTEMALEEVSVVSKEYSKSTESLYVKVDVKDFINFINKISKIGMRFIVTNEDLLEEESFSVRFSTHNPSGFKENSKEISVSNGSRDILIFTNTSIVHNRRMNEYYQSSAVVDTSIEKEIDKKLAKAKMYSSKKIKRLKNKELEDYYYIMQFLQGEKSMIRNKFVGTFDNNIAGVLKEAEKRNMSI